MKGLADRLGRALGEAVADLRPVAGGDVNRAFAARTASGRRVFVKTQDRPPAGMFPAEARGLRWLGEAGALRVPAVLHVEDGPGGFLALEWIEPGRPDARTWERLGRGLAALHRAGAPGFGLDHDNFIGRLPQANAPLPSGGWAAFWVERRLRPQVRRAADRGLLPGRLRADLDALMRDLLAHPGRLGPAEPPARLHGDLWRGNLLVAAGGEPCLVDPAAWAGHREVDLAMMHLFGGFDPRCFAAYAEAWPLAPGHAARRPVYQLYYLLVHVNLFGAGWVGGVADAVRRFRRGG